MKPPYDRMIGKPVEIAHLSKDEQAALLEEAKQRNMQSKWGRRHRRMLVCALIIYVQVMFVVFSGRVWSAAIPPWVYVLALALLLMVPFAVLGNLDSRHRHDELQSLLLERGIRPAVCFTCRYDLRESAGDTCPECGEVIAKSSTQA